MSTLLIQIKAILNSRPLCPLSDDAEDLLALTPGHFLIGEALSIIPEPKLSEERVTRLSRWQLIRQKVEHFWIRWSTECLQRQLARSKWFHPNKIKLGSMVLITDERYPLTKWPLTRIVELQPGEDGLVQVVTVQTTTSTFKRLISKLSILPIETDSETVPEGGRGMFRKPLKNAFGKFYMLLTGLFPWSARSTLSRPTPSGLSSERAARWPLQLSRTRIRKYYDMSIKGRVATLISIFIITPSSTQPREYYYCWTSFSSKRARALNFGHSLLDNFSIGGGTFGTTLWN